MTSPALGQLLQQAIGLHRGGHDFDRAEKTYRLVLDAAPRHFDANYLLGLLYLQTGKFSKAKRHFEQAIKINPNAAHALNELGNALIELDRAAEALAYYDRATALDPAFAEAHNNRGRALESLGRFDEAILSFSKAIEAKPGNAPAFYNLGNCQRNLKQFQAALASYDRAIAVRPTYFEAHINRGNTLLDMGRADLALAAYDAAISINPSFALAHYNRARALTELKQFDAGLAACERALALAPDTAEAWIARGNALHNLTRYEDSLGSFDRALAIDSNAADGWLGRAIALRNLKRHEEAADAFVRLLRVAPEHHDAKGELAFEKLTICHWDGLADLRRSIDDDVRAGKLAVTPFAYQALSHSAGDLQLCARAFVEKEFPAAAVPLCDGGPYRHDRIRIGYMSGDFRQHAVAMLIVECFERHDKREFEIVAFDTGTDDGSGMRRRIEAAVERIVDIRGLSDVRAAEEIKRNEIDILVDLTGYTGAARVGVLAQRPAPVQVNYLGYPGTLGATYVDYILADHVVIPPEDERYFTEKVVRLPDAYQCNDRKRAVADRTPTRADTHLPENGFVFCCFNNNYKITPDVFGIWMRLLKAVDGSVLWLLRDNASAARNLQSEAERQGIAKERLVFAPNAALPDHLARHRLADLFVDTLPYNAHTTASDALWAGLPVLTCSGTAFAGRVATSLLQAAGLPELITSSPEAYEELALELARQPDRLAALKEKLARHRLTCALFDSVRMTRHIEVAYRTMWQRQQNGEAPAGFAVAPLAHDQGTRQ
jgi:predicted O-linked N-acetylglucosamine transferase (SPINDLY family)